MKKNLISTAFLLVALVSFGQQGNNIDLEEVVNIADVIPQIYLNDDVYSFRERDTLLKKLLRLPFWKGLTEFKINLEDFETAKVYSFESKGPLRIFINNNELTKRHLFKTFTSIKKLSRNIEKFEIRTNEEKKNVKIFKTNYIQENDVILGGKIIKDIQILESEIDSKAFPVTHVKITANLNSKTLYNRISKKEIKLTQEFEQAGSIALDAIEVVKKTKNDGLFYSPTYINGELTFEKNDRLAELYDKGKKFKKMGLNEWGIDVDANNWFTALRAFIGAKAVRATSDGIPILFNSITFGDTLLPLWVVDGVYLSQAPISVTALTPFIREVKVLKYAEASEYGSRGAGGVIVINTSIGIQQNFLNRKRSYLVKGKKNKRLMINYQEFEKQFKLKIEQLKVEKKYALENDNKVRLDSFQRLIKSTLTKSYLYTINFIIKNSDYEIAPYLAYTKVSDANILLLDSIAGSLSKRAKRSIYGKKFIALLKERKAKN